MASFLTRVLARWTLPTNLGVPIFNGGSFFGEFMSSIGRNLGRFPNGPPLNDPFWYVLRSHILHASHSFVPQIESPCSFLCKALFSSRISACWCDEDYDLDNYMPLSATTARAFVALNSASYSVRYTVTVQQSSCSTSDRALQSCMAVLRYACTDTGKHDFDSQLLPVCLLSLKCCLYSSCRLYLTVYHAGLFLTLFLGQIGVQGRRQGYWN